MLFSLLPIFRDMTAEMICNRVQHLSNFILERGHFFPFESQPRCCQWQSLLISRWIIDLLLKICKMVFSLQRACRLQGTSCKIAFLLLYQPLPDAEQHHRPLFKVLMVLTDDSSPRFQSEEACLHPINNVQAGGQLPSSTVCHGLGLESSVQNMPFCHQALMRRTYLMASLKLAKACTPRAASRHVTMRDAVFASKRVSRESSLLGCKTNR